MQLYHGTTSLFTSSILSQGLIPDPKRKFWDDVSKSSVELPSRKSLYGTYFTSDLLLSIDCAKNATSKFGGKPLIVVADINPKSAISDEDNIWCHVDDCLYSLIHQINNRWEFDAAAKFLGYFDSCDDYDRKYYVKRFAEKLHRELTRNPLHPIDYELLENVYHAALNRILSHLWKADKIKFKIDYQSNHKRFQTFKGVISTIEDGEDGYLHEIDKLCYRYKDSTKIKESFRHTLRMIYPVRFTGKNKIISIIEYNMDTGSKLIYGESPQISLEDAEEFFSYTCRTVSHS